MEDRDVLGGYLQALLSEREAYLEKHAENKAQTLMRSMSSAEREAYLRGPGFEALRRQVRRKDKVYQSLTRGELAQTWQKAEFELLAPLIREELSAGRPVSLPLLRSAQRCRVSAGRAHQAIRLLTEGAPGRFFAGQREQAVKDAEKQLERFLRQGDVSRLFRPDGQVEQVLPHVMKTVFARGIPADAISLAFQDRPLNQSLRSSLNRAYPVLSECARVSVTGESTVGSLVKNEIHLERNRICNLLRRRFHQERIRSLLAKNSSLSRLQKKTDAAFEKERKIRSALLEAIPAHYRDLYPLAREMHRHFVLHLGPTNSGKTYEGVSRLHSARCGIYLGPLRLLAAEQFETLNMDDVPCSLVTGEEQIRVPGSVVQSSTVEMADLKKHYDIAVIDECQMIADRDRGGAWSAAVLGLCADEIHACASPDAESLLTRIITDCGDELTIVRHERMTPLEVEKEGFQFPASVRPGDALIVFSKARVHAVAAELRSRGMRVSLIYGALPPDVRRNQAERFHRGETDVVVSTDAIAMGMNLPIQRVVFLESEKYDGDIPRPLTDAEIKQIAGRAGRYGIYDIGYVNAFGFRQTIAQALARPLLPLTEAVIRFPESLLGIPLPLTQIIGQWLNMQDRDCFSKASAVRMASLAAMMETRTTDKALLYRFLCIPFDETDPDLLSRWKTFYHLEATGSHADVLPDLPEYRNPEECTIQLLDTLEADYRRCDLLYNYARLFIDPCEKLLDEIQRRKDLISQGIIHVLSTQKLMQKTCRSCKRHLAWNWPYRLCDSCFRRQHFSRNGRP